MRSSPFLALALGVSMVLCAGATFAQEPSQPQTVSEILQFQHALRAKLDAPTGEYSNFDEDALARMKRAQDNVFHMFAGVTSLDQLNAEQKINVSNSLDEIKSILLANDGNRLICHRERKTGTNLVSRRCETPSVKPTHAMPTSRSSTTVSVANAPGHVDQYARTGQVRAFCFPVQSSRSPR